MNSNKQKIKTLPTNKDYQVTKNISDNKSIFLTEKKTGEKFKLDLQNVLSGGSGDNVYSVSDCNNHEMVLKVFQNDSGLTETTKQIDFSYLFSKEFKQSDRFYLPCPLIFRHGLLSGVKPLSNKKKLNKLYYILMEKMEGEDLHTYFKDSNCLNYKDDDEIYDIIMQLFFLISRMKVNEQGIYMSHCDLHTKNIYICNLPKEKEIILDFNHIGINETYTIKNNIVKILDLGESFEYRKTDDGKKYKTCRLNRSMTKKLVHTFSKCYDKKYKIKNGNHYGKQFMKKTKKIGKKSGKYLKALSQRLRAGQNKSYGDEDLRFFVTILRLFMFQYKGIKGIKSNIKHIEKLSKLVSLVDKFYDKEKTIKELQKNKNKEYAINYDKIIKGTTKERINNILGGIYKILVLFKS